MAKCKTKRKAPRKAKTKPVPVVALVFTALGAMSVFIGIALKLV